MLDQLIDEIIAREGSKDTNDPKDSGGRTKYGISERANPDAWVGGPPTLEKAKDIYFQRYIINPNIHKISPAFLMFQIADFGVNSGPFIAIQHLQRILKVKDDGDLGPITLAALSTRDPEVVNNQLVDDRVLMFARLVQKRNKDIKWLFGWLTRALSFRR